MYLYRTETFSGLNERSAAEVMAYETFEMNNSDILETLFNYTLKDSPLSETLSLFLDELNREGFIDNISFEDGVQFFENVLDEIEKITGTKVNYALWLTDINHVLDFYGKYINSPNDIDCYETSNIILSIIPGELPEGFLFGFTEYPEPIDLEKNNFQKAFIEEHYESFMKVEPEYLNEVKRMIQFLPEDLADGLSKRFVVSNPDIVLDIAEHYQKLVKHFYEDKLSAFVSAFTNILNVDVLKHMKHIPLNEKINEIETRKSNCTGINKDTLVDKEKDRYERI